jgi:Phenazine biosynthesis-like protein
MRIVAKLMLFAAISSKLIGQSTGNNFDQWDVFTDRVLTGNQVPVFIDPKGLDTNTMMGIAREFDHSEATFVYPSRIGEAAFRVRIFHPGINKEIPIAGHPIIGTIFALANAGKIKPGTTKILLDLDLGPTPVEMVGQRTTFNLHGWTSLYRSSKGSLPTVQLWPQPWVSTRKTSAQICRSNRSIVEDHSLWYR